MQRKPKSVPLEVFKKLNLVGTPDECIPKKQQYADQGVRTYPSYMFLGLPNMGDIRPFAETVVKRQNQLIDGALLINLKFAKW